MTFVVGLLLIPTDKLESRKLQFESANTSPAIGIASEMTYHTTVKTYHVMFLTSEGIAKSWLMHLEVMHSTFLIGTDFLLALIGIE